MPSVCPQRHRSRHRLLEHVRRGLAAIARSPSPQPCAPWAPNRPPPAHMSRTVPQGAATVAGNRSRPAARGHGLDLHQDGTGHRLRPRRRARRSGRPVPTRGPPLPQKDSDPNKPIEPIPSNRKAYCMRYLAEYVTLGEDNKVNGKAHVLVSAAAASELLPNAQWKEEIANLRHRHDAQYRRCDDGLSSAACSGQCTAAPAWGARAPCSSKNGQGREDGTLSLAARRSASASTRSSSPPTT